MKALLGRKIGMTQIFDDAGNVVPVTVIEAGPCTVTQIKTTDHDGYEAVQLGFGNAKKPKRPQMGHLKLANSNARYLREFPTPDTELTVGHELNVTNFEVGDQVQITGTSKGKGFAGTIKRHNFHRGPKTHGSRNYRAPGSIGAGYPEHVFKGKRMAGQMGNERVSVKNLKIVLVDANKNLLAVSGAVPGPKRGLVMVRGL